MQPIFTQIMCCTHIVDFTKKMKEYKGPKIELVFFENDVVRTSLNSDGDNEQGVDCGAKWFY